MDPTSPWSSEGLYSNAHEQDRTQKQFVIGHSAGSRKIIQKFYCGTRYYQDSKCQDRSYYYEYSE